MKMLNRLQPVQKREVGVTANELLSLIDWMKGDVSQLSIRYSQFEAYTYNVHGRVALDEGIEDSARRVEAYYEKVLQVSRAIGDDEGIASVKSNIALAKSKYKSGNNIEELVLTSQEFYRMRIAKQGEENVYTIRAGKIYACQLQSANRRGEARELLTKLLATSKQVLGGA